MRGKRKLNFEAFLAAHPVFHLEELARARHQPNCLEAARNQLKHHLHRGRIKRVARKVFAAVPFGQEAETYQPDSLLVATRLRPDGVFCYHTALELFGAGHSLWNVCTLFCEKPPTPLSLDSQRIQFLAHPTVLHRQESIHLGLRSTERQGQRLKFTGPERTLVEGFRQPRWVGGLEELILSATGFGVLDLDLLEQILAVYDKRILWAAVGWFLEQHQDSFFVPDAYLNHLQRKSPHQARYLLRSERGGRLQSRWKLIVPDRLLIWEGQHA